VHLIHHLPFKFDSLPAAIPPAVVVRVDHLRRAMRALRLISRDWVRIDKVAVIHAEAVPRTGGSLLDQACKVAALLGLQSVARMGAVRRRSGTALDDDFHLPP
jgi:hypothetical protein